jgi:hypothetical protein
MTRWERRGRDVPVPHLVKQQVLRDHARRFDLATLVETGTCDDDMVRAQLREFRTIYSIVLDTALYEAAAAQFRNHAHVHIVHGDSGTVLAVVLHRLTGPALFWLDGHYSAGVTALGAKETPILEELAQILATGEDQVIIYDARLLGFDPAYPTLAALKVYVLAGRPHATIKVELDSIRATYGAESGPVRNGVRPIGSGRN